MDSSTRSLLILGAFLLALSVVSDAVLRHSDAFWLSSINPVTTDRSSPLYVDAQLHTWPHEEKRVVVVGSSVAATDVDEELLAASLGIEEHELGVLWMPDASAVELAMLTPALAEVKPRVVVYLLTVWNFFDTDDLGKMRFYDPGVAASLFRPSEIISDLPAHMSGMLSWHHVVIRHREYLRRSLFAPLLEWLGETPRQRRRQQWLQPNTARDRVLRRRNRRMTAGPDDFVCSGLRTRALSLMGERLASGGIEFLIVRTPVQGRWDNDAPVQSRVDACMSGQAERENVGYVAMSQLPPFSPDEFRDPLHMTRDAERKFTKAIADHISPSLAADASRPTEYAFR